MTHFGWRSWKQGTGECRAYSGDNGRVYSLGWRAQVPIKQGIALTYPWIEEQVKKARAAKAT